MNNDNMNNKTLNKSNFVWAIFAIIVLIGISVFLFYVSRLYEEYLCKKATEELLSSAETANAEEITRLTQEGADVNATGWYGITPLMLAAEKNQNPEVLRILIENGADVNAVTKSKRTPLMYAAENRSNSEALQVLIENGADVNAVTKSKRTPLMYAAENRSNPEVIRILIENGADINAVGGVYEDTPLILAARSSNSEGIRILLENGADVTIINKNGHIALDLTHRARIGSAYDLLREKTIENIKNTSELMIVLGKTASVEEVTWLLQEGADVNTVDSTGKTALMTTASQNSNPDVLRILIENGADASIKDKDGKRALDYAQKNKKVYGTDVYNLLMEKTLGTTLDSWASTSSIEWQKSFAREVGNRAIKVVQTIDGCYALAGNFRSDNKEVTSGKYKPVCCIVKLDSKGEVIWDSAIKNSDRNFITSLQKTQDGGVIVAGISDVKSKRKRAPFAPPMDCWIVKLDAEGNTIWSKTLSKSNHSRIYSIQQLENGDFIAAGYFDDDKDHQNYSSSESSARGGDYWILRIDSEGNTIWQKTFGGYEVDIAYSIKQTIDDGYIVTGMTYSIDGDVSVIHGSTGYWIIKLNFDGEIEWSKLVGGSNMDKAYDIYSDENGHIVAGFSNSNNGDVSDNHGKSDYWIVKLNLKGDIVWQKSFGGSGGDAAYSIAKTLDDCYIITGYSSSSDGDVFYNHGKADYWIIKIDSDGGLIWEKTYGGSETDVATSSCYTNDGGMIIVGYSESKNGDVSESHVNSDYWVIKLKLND